MIADKIAGLSELTPVEKLSLASELWEELEQLEGDIPVTEAQKALLDERFAEHGENPTPGSSWEEVKKRLLGRIEGDGNHHPTRG